MTARGVGKSPSLTRGQSFPERQKIDCFSCCRQKPRFINVRPLRVLVAAGGVNPPSPCEVINLSQTMVFA